MRAQERRNDLQRHLLLQLPHNAQNFQFIFNGQTVARLRFDCGRATAQEPIGAFPCLREKISLARCTRFFHR